MKDAIDDRREQRARALETALQARGIECTLHAHQAFWAVRIPLIDVASSSAGHRSLVPTLLVLPQDAELNSLPSDSVMWMGRLAGFSAPENDGWLGDTRFVWMEQTSAGENPESVANAVVSLVLLLVLGIDNYLAAVAAGEHDPADPQESPAGRANHDHPDGR